MEETGTIYRVQLRKATVRGSTPCDAVRECRICLSGEEQGGELVSICGCSGSVQFVHTRCFREWVLKKAEDPGQREQILGPQGLSCEICHQRYRYTYQMITHWVDCPTFRKKLSDRIMLASSVILFTILDLIILGIIMSYAISDPKNPNYDIRQARFFIVYMALGFALLSALYGILQFIRLFLQHKSLELTPEQSKNSKQTKVRSKVVSSNGTNRSQSAQVSRMRMQDWNGLVQYI